MLGRLLASGMFKPAYLDGTTAILLVPSRVNVPLLTDASVQQAGLGPAGRGENRYRAPWNSPASPGAPDGAGRPR
ncbi:MAG: hypothetical protein U1F87_02100 [Kiritimatiellia bacterium]